jgi:hypothetical protein
LSIQNRAHVTLTLTLSQRERGIARLGPSTLLRVYHKTQPGHARA